RAPGRDTPAPSGAGSSNGSRSRTIRRRAAGAGTPSAPSSAGSLAGEAGRSGATDPENTLRNTSVADELSQLLDSPEGREWFREQLKDHIDLVVRALEDHVIVELERRGGRSWGNL
ncbi:MAG: hypothetical protein WD225_13850, partial [Ilumatobacteraceae bacterium]